MKYLVDTNIFLWYLNSDRKLKDSTKSIIVNPNNIIYVSVVSAWEISIKLKTNALFKLKTSIKNAFQISGFEVLNISLEHVLSLHNLPLYHKDPFDRMLVAQALVENCVLITNDPKIKKYRVRTVE